MRVHNANIEKQWRCAVRILGFLKNRVPKVFNGCQKSASTYPFRSAMKRVLGGPERMTRLLGPGLM